MIEIIKIDTGYHNRANNKIHKFLVTPFKQWWQKELHILFCSTPTNLGQFSKPGTDLKSVGPDVFKTPPTCKI